MATGEKRSGGPSKALGTLAALLAVAGLVLVGLGLYGVLSTATPNMKGINSGQTVSVPASGMSMWAEDDVREDTVCQAGDTTLERPTSAYSVMVGDREFFEVARTPSDLDASSYVVTCEGTDAALYVGPNAARTTAPGLIGQLGLIIGAITVGVAALLALAALLTRRKKSAGADSGAYQYSSHAKTQDGYPQGGYQQGGYQQGGYQQGGYQQGGYQQGGYQQGGYQQGGYPVGQYSDQGQGTQGGSAGYAPAGYAQPDQTQAYPPAQGYDQQGQGQDQSGHEQSGYQTGYGQGGYSPQDHGYGQQPYTPEQHQAHGGYGQQPYTPEQHQAPGGYGQQPYTPEQHQAPGGYGQQSFGQDAHPAPQEQASAPGEHTNEPADTGGQDSHREETGDTESMSTGASATGATAWNPDQQGGDEAPTQVQDGPSQGDQGQDTGPESGHSVDDGDSADSDDEGQRTEQAPPPPPRWD